jgi:hypothetical protein
VREKGPCAECWQKSTLPLYRSVNGDLLKRIAFECTKGLVSHSQRPNVTGKRRDLMLELQRVPNEFAARATPNTTSFTR